MAIDINNSTFKMFTDFAVQFGEKSSKIAQLGSITSPSGEKRTIQATTNGDYVWHVLRNADLAKSNNDVRKLFRDTVAKMFGGEKSIPEPIKKAMRLKDYDNGKPLTARRILAVQKAIIKYSTFSVGGTGQCVQLMKDTMKRKLDSIPGTNSQKLAQLRTDMSNTAKNRFNLFFCEEMKNLQTGHSCPQFDKDASRLGFEVKLKIGENFLTYDESTPIKEQKNAIARFITQGKTQNFDDLSAADKNKAFVAMSFISQNHGISLRNGVSVGLSPDLSWQPVRLAGDDDSTKSVMSLSFGESGELTIDYHAVTSPRIGFYDSKDAMEQTVDGFQPGAEMQFNNTVNIPAEELKRLSTKDYSNYSSDAADKTMANRKLKNPYQHAVGTLGDFGLCNDVTFDLKFSVNFTDCTFA